MSEKPLKILGFYPGTTIDSYGMVEIRNKVPVILNMGTIIPGKFSDHYERLKYLHERALFLVKEYQPDVMALEAPFYGKNVQSMLKLGRGQGVIMAAALLHGIPIFEYAPLLVKQAITGMGRASKEQVAYFLQKVYHLNDLELEWGKKLTDEKFIDLTDNSIKQITINPKQFPIIQKKKKIRKCVLTKHNSMFYQIGSESIDILRIFDTRQDPRKLKFV